MQSITNYLTIDVEDYFQVAAFDSIVRIDEWDQFESRVIENTNKVLRLLEEYDTKATFFILGWVAEHFPDLVKRIDNAGHTIGCHSHLHRKVYSLSPGEFKKDTRKAKETLENIIGRAVTGYRAPSYSITKKSIWALEILEELGFVYDSSIFPITHDNYGISGSPRFPYRHSGLNLYEYPISTAIILGRIIPVSGGGYFRLFPYWFNRMALRSINHKEKQPFNFYLHPWELDPDQPRFNNASLLSRFRHYNHLQDTEKRLRRLLEEFEFKPFPEITINT